MEAGSDLAGAKVLVLGYAYLENSDDTRNSPSATMVAALRERGAEVVIHDPYVEGYQGDVIEMAEGCDAIAVMVKHNVYQQLDWASLRAQLRHPVLVDGRHVINETPEGFVYREIGAKKK